MRPEDYEKQILERLNFLMPRRQSKRKHFAIGLLLVAPFCLILGFFPTFSADIFYKMLWIAFGLILLMVGAWQWDKSHREVNSDEEGLLSTKVKGAKTSGTEIRRIK